MKMPKKDNLKYDYTLNYEDNLKYEDNPNLRYNKLNQIYQTKPYKATQPNLPNQTY